MFAQRKNDVQSNRKQRSINYVIILTSVYIFCQIIADITANKIVNIFGFYVPAAVFIYAITFTWRDLIHKRLGKKAAVTTVLMAGLVNVLMALYFVFTVKLPAAPYWENQSAYSIILGSVPRIVLASISAEIISELIDTEMYELLKNKPQWMRVILSNAVSLPIDSGIFVTIAFIGVLPGMVLLSTILGQIAVKAVITVFSIPMIYMIPAGGEPELLTE